jgi:hypothetical protein
MNDDLNPKFEISVDLLELEELLIAISGAYHAERVRNRLVEESDETPIRYRENALLVLRSMLRSEQRRRYTSLM